MKHDLTDRIVIIGVDGANYKAIRPLLAQGRLPHLKRLIDEGTLCKNALAPYPTLTGSNWATIATGAWPGTHGATDMSYHVTGEPLDHWHNSFTSDAVEAETIWEAAVRQGKKAIVLKYPGSWPPRDKQIIMVDGGGGRPFWGGSFLEISHSQLFSTEKFPNSHSLNLHPASGWKNLPVNERSSLEAEFSLVGESGNVPSSLQFGKGQLYHTEPIKLHLLVSTSSGNGFDTVYLCRSKNIRDALCTLREGDWSKSMVWDFRKDGKTVRGGVRIKLQKLDPETGDVVLFFPQIYPVDSFTQPSDLGAKLVERFGAYLNHPGFSELAMGWFENNTETFFELIDYQNKWLGKAGQYLMENNDWDIFAMQTHCIDFANHIFVPRYGWSDQQCKQALTNLARCYESVDNMVGEIVAGAGKNAVIVVVSDHGATESLRPEVFINPILSEAGLLSFKGDTDRLRVDYSKTQAVQQRAAFIYINLAGRDPGGIVPADQYEVVRQKVIDALREYRAPHTGENPFSMILRKEDAYILGLFDSLGRDIGDIVYALRPEYDHEHGRQLTTASTETQTMKPLLIFNGPTIKRGHILERPAWLVDIVPTICEAIGLSAPTEAEGAILYQIFASHRTKFPRKEMLKRQYKKLLKFKDIKEVHFQPSHTEKTKGLQKDRTTKPKEEEQMPSTVPELQAALKKARQEARRWKEAYDRYHRITHGN